MASRKDLTLSRRPHRLPVLVGALGGVFFVTAGVWAMVAPESFFDGVASFEPYNQHFIQDIGAFQVGLGFVLLLAVLARGADVLAVALTGVGIAAVAHVVSHLVGRDLGGEPLFDIPSLTILAVLLLVGGIVRWRSH